ncbi:MAG: hypothetical protein L0H96_03420 [Humibacillus sp.]|nr:hypothetical protein [Humibacillus sp.]MDN5775941.1 hypothetical protein [Humibacillus sp.]
MTVERQKAIPALDTPGGHETPGTGPSRAGRRRLLLTLQLGTGACALAGGVLLMVAPDGSLLQADPSVLEGTPFADWRMPGILLTILVGGGLLAAGSWQWHRRPHARAVSMLAGLGLIAFEAAELAWIGFQPLEGAFALVGAVIFGLSVLETRP